MSSLPDVLIIGDSISIGYTPHVAELLAGKAAVTHNPGNGGDSDNVLANLDAWLADRRWGVIHFNCGLHDIKRARGSGGLQVPLERYRSNLERIVQRLKATGAALAWATSTPVIEARHNAVKDLDRLNADVDACNAAAAEIMLAAGVRIDDLYSAVVAAGPATMLCDDGVHMTAGGYIVLARAVAGAIERALAVR
jgi:lysophospholipase L1-like esterase